MKDRLKSFLFFICLGLTLIAIYFNYFLNINIIYTHLFYIVIVITGVLFYRYVIYVALYLGLLHICLDYLSSGLLSLSTLLRAIIMLIVAIILYKLIEKLKREKKELGKVDDLTNKLILSNKMKVLFLLFICLGITVLSIYFNYFLNINIVYTHLFYVVIAVCGIWFYRYVIYVAAYLGFLHILVAYLSSGALSVDALYRSIIILFVAMVIYKLFYEIEIKNKSLENMKTTLQLVFDNLQEIVTYIDKDFNIVWVNKSASKFFNINPEQSIGEKCYAVLLGRDKPCEDCPASYSISTGEPITKERNMKNNDFMISITPITQYNGEVVGVIKSHLNISDYKDNQKKLVKMQNLNLIGSMAAGIAHEIRNPMTTIRGFLQLLENNENSETIKLMIEELDSANKIIKDFLLLSKANSFKLLKQDLNDLIISLYPLIISNADYYNINVELELKEIPNLSLDEIQIRKLIINLIQNSIESMQGEGKIIIKTYMDINNVTLCIKDEGHGIDSSIKDMVDIPFFTTKDDKIGLGLSICYYIAKNHNAELTFDSNNLGTNFYLKFKETESTIHNSANTQEILLT
ncbi:hypothetical protein SYNTR_0036 [Candidatus Syntrophocurvum alkaliphilum]|uniref:histidine kinase n=1 Tax=Candidatus Syntrophocurvum alkaliphilum TaxID=2293317 RepID=A0A6I6DFZ5_9FIRM|nr:histidine kinase dimerization/phospho-acceptor domain-containing protein [Candidatus Syntrophocurvum alkaliphilum]QGT98629.1 hypothetical protein SYNTR_0036 [Candidatus Syntrophocurvum alkaliphilum]